MNLPTATADTRVVVALAGRMLRSMPRSGDAYKRAGVALMDLARPRDLQADLFAPPTIGDDVLMATLDRINRRFGRGSIGLGAIGWQARPAWGCASFNSHGSTRRG